MEGYIGEIKYFAGTYAPQSWCFCEGQQLPIVQYTALYSLIGTQFGGDGKTYFNLPDLRGRMVLGPGQSAGTSLRHQGDKGGYETITLTANTIPVHNHTVKCDTSSPPPQMTKNPQDKLFATVGSGINKYASVEAGNLMKSDAVTMEGGSQPHENMPPWIALRFIICLNGYYPVRP